jgi:HD-GYP domain-containing protein (c-di-GMP phosphodiesterase class II)
LIPLDPRDELCRVSRWMDIARAYDSSLYLHSVAVSELTARFAAYLNFTPIEQQRLTRAALLHDIGKVRIPIGILKKLEPLSSEERRLIGFCVLASRIARGRPLKDLPLCGIHQG